MSDSEKEKKLSLMVETAQDFYNSDLFEKYYLGERLRELIEINSIKDVVYFISICTSAFGHGHPISMEDFMDGLKGVVSYVKLCQSFKASVIISFFESLDQIYRNTFFYFQDEKDGIAFQDLSNEYYEKSSSVINDARKEYLDSLFQTIKDKIEIALTVQKIVRSKEEALKA